MATKASKKLKKWRLDNDLTQAELADLLGVSERAVQVWEYGGRPSYPHMRKIEKATGIEIGEWPA